MSFFIGRSCIACRPALLRYVLPLFIALAAGGLWSTARAVEQAHCVAMHVHGSFSEGDGSMEWHTDKASQVGVDAIWWSEHDWRSIQWHYTTKYNFETAVYEPQFIRWSEPDDASPGDFRWWMLSGIPQALYATAMVDSLSLEGQKSFLLYANDAWNSSQFRTVYWHQEGSVKQSKYSLASRVKVHFAVFPEKLAADSSKFVLEAGLSLHPEGSHVLRYVLGSMDEEGPYSTSLPFVPGTWNEYTIDVCADAIEKFTSGGADSLRAEDNSLFQLRVMLGARQGYKARVFLDDFRYIRDTTQTEATVLAKQEQLADYYEAQTPSVRQITGTEISRFRAQPHLNAFTPTPMMIDYGTHIWSDSMYYAVEQVHEAGGAISLNHMYGSGIYGNLNETAEQKALRILAMKNSLIRCRAYGADLLEVGYRWRGGIVLNDHLDTWDALTANAIFMTGNGVSDSHGQTPFNGWAPWQQHASFENNFATWFWASELSEVPLIEAMVSGRAFFGDPYAFHGTVDLATGEGFPMGRVVATDKNTHELLISVVDVGDSAQVRLRQGEIKTSGPAVTTVNWIRDEILEGTLESGSFADSVTLDTALSSFVRIEVTNGGTGGGSLRAYSNPLHFLRDIPAAGVLAPRVAASLGPILIRSATCLTLRSALFDTSTATLTIGVDETPAGSGGMVIDCGILGEPGSVTGAASVVFESGVLTVSQFSGPGSTIQVTWGAVGVSDDGGAVREVSLSTGRPNPFREEGTICEYALPSKGPVKLDVLDVRGRLVRTLVDASRDAGVHRVGWNGTDSGGRSVANGVYFLRLVAGGRTLSSKVVKTR